ncbi:hypothetical protein LRS10_10350 [Phenylobacterium sp. J426]|uniref:hypothetical protein n=1 Tax=Phenylobacterium sp. J426 TaxID=2898439 RepID=UPI0021508D71|nr:hypothetical protein [Phenylobacterium sp. J426]MCR5874533.1 hypothetical protein [Phenylobacterium sp. J426]
MTVRREGDVVWLEGACRVEEAETVVGLLGAGMRTVDLSRCQALHAAVAQVLLAFRPALRGGAGGSLPARAPAPGADRGWRSGDKRPRRR